MSPSPISWHMTRVGMEKIIINYSWMDWAGSGNDEACVIRHIWALNLFLLIAHSA